MPEDPKEVLSYIDGADYPASKQDVIGTAEARGAPQEMVEALQVLAQERFVDPEAVEDALRASPRL
ncbi:MAG: DUF2795 domain-containing protein [Actinobacteria bacterium]|nr:DUF2795 domain-containing protein [Actinomycetota bacterium]